MGEYEEYEEELPGTGISIAASRLTLVDENFEKILVVLDENMFKSFSNIIIENKTDPKLQENYEKLTKDHETLRKEKSIIEADLKNKTKTEQQSKVDKQRVTELEKENKKFKTKNPL